MSEREVGERVREKMKKQTRLACVQLTNCFVHQKTQPKLSHCYLLVISGPLYSIISLYPQTLLQKQWHCHEPISSFVTIQSCSKVAA